MPALAEKTAAEKVEPQTAPVVEEPKRLEWWKKPILDADILRRLRQILALGELDELPEEVYLQCALRMAIDPSFVMSEVTTKELVDIVLQAANYPVQKERSWVYPGAKITIKDQQADAIYMCRGPFGRDLVNRYGVFFLLKPENIEAGDEAVRDSELNRHARRSQRIPDPQKLLAGVQKPNPPKPTPAAKTPLEPAPTG